MKIENVVKKFNNNLDYSCPKCGNLSTIQDKSLVCIENHSYDFSKKGYIHLINNYKDSKYSEDLFEARDYVFSKDFYRHILDALENEIKNLPVTNILDLGCGEGYYIRELKEIFPDKYFYGLDNAKSAIEFAVRKDKKNPYMLANLANIPFADKTVDLILNILSPANYEEFSRVLKEESRIIKIIPSSNYLKEIRELFSIDNYSNTDTVELISKNLVIESRNLVSKKYYLTYEDAKNFLKMTPLSFSREIKEADIEKLKEISIELEILVLKTR